MFKSNLGLNKVINTSASIMILLFITGCTAITGHKQSLNDFDVNLKNQKCDYTMIDEKIKSDDDTILWGIQGGSLARNCMNYKKSNELFDEAEKKYKEDVDKDGIVSNAGESVKSVLVNDNINDYEGNTYEKIMVNTYKALNFASINDHASARVEFNRALDRQRRALEYYENELKEKKNQKNDANNKKIAENNKTQEVIYKKYNTLLNDFEAYPDFVNPFTTYISGIYFMLNNDFIKARDLLKESSSMDPKNEQIKKDFELVNNYSSLKKTNANYAWIIYENGQSMVKDELRVDIPLFLVTNKVMYTGIALPQIKERKNSYNYLLVNNNKTVEICNMDNVIKTEFKKRFPAIVTEKIISTITKTVAQKQIQDRAGILGGLATAVYQSITNKADVRSWTALPKNFQSIRVEINSKPIEIKNDRGEIIKSVLIPKGKNAIIYVKSQNLGNNNVHEILF